MKYFVKTNSISSLYEINRVVRKLDIDANVYQGRNVIDVNSILGVLALDWSRGVTIEFINPSADDQILITTLHSLSDTEVRKLD